MTGGTSHRPWLVGWLVRLYPRGLREAHEVEMAAFLEARLERVRGRPVRTVGVVAGALRDVVETWRAERAERRRISRTERKREHRMGGMMQDLRYAFRRLARTPVFSLGALLIMAIAIGANTAVFAVVNGMLLAPPPYGDVSRVVNIYQDTDDGDVGSTSFPAYRDMASLEGVFTSVGATTPAGATLEENGVRRSLAIEFTTASYLSVIGRTVTRGRWFDAAMDHPGAGNYAVVSERAWRTKFGSDPSIVGRSLLINGEPVTVIGVGPQGFNGVGGFVVTDLWLSISSVGVGGDYRVGNLDRREDHWYDVKARLAPGVTVNHAQDAMSALATRLAETYPELNAGRGITVFPATRVRVHPDVDGQLWSAGSVLMVVVLLVLILAATNLGSLLLVRGVTRGPEVAVRRALGAASSRVAGLFLSEAMVLSVCGGLLGLFVAHALLSVLAAAPLPLPVSGDIDLALNLPVLLFSVGLMVATGLFFGLAPAVQSLRTDVSGALREDRRSAGPGRRLSFTRNAMVAVQVAVSLALVVGAAFMVRRLESWQRIDPGVDAEHIAYIRTTFDDAGITGDARAPVLQQLRDRFASTPGVTAVTLASRLPVQRGGTTTMVVDGYEPAAGTGSVELPWVRIGPGYFDAIGIRVLRGRVYLPADREGTLPGVVVNETAALRFWGTLDAVGRRIRSQGDEDGWIDVIGVVSDTKVNSLSEPPTPLLYLPLPPSGAGSLYFLVRTASDPAAVLSSLRTGLRNVNSQLPVDELDTLDGHLGSTLASARMTAGLLGLFSLLALLLAGIGIYTIVSFSVAGRMPEIGIRVALGAARGRVIRMVVGEVALTVGIGLALGTALVILLNARLGPSIGGRLEPATLGLAAAVMALAVGVAAWLPARRAAAVDPVEALRGT